jgi:PiT family inorganic phosphate transporter
MSVTVLVVFTIAAALVFDIVNGFHDAANSIATVVSTRVLTPRAAVLWAAAFNFIALFLFQDGVAQTISKVIRINPADGAFVYVVVAGLLGAIAWNLLTWWLGLPSSSSHALIGGLAGAGVTYGGLGVLEWPYISKIVYFILLAPLIGLFLGGALMIAVSWMFRRMRPRRVDRTFRVGQLLSAALYSIGHGGNDAQKTAGVILAVLVASKWLPADTVHVPGWVIVASYGAMAFGTAIGGWRIVKTMGMGLTHLKPVGGFCAEIAGAVTLFAATSLKIPVSTTHTITGAILGVGSVNHVRAIRWGLAQRIVWAWIFTIPAAGLVAAGVLSLCRAAGAW